MTTVDGISAHSSTRVPRVGQLLSKDFVLLDVAAKSIDRVCELLVERLVHEGVVPSGKAPDLLERILARERAAPTAIGLSAACPHAFVDYLDQQISARVVNSPHFQLKKGPAYHLDLLIVGVLTGLCSLLGWPWLVAATVRSLNHVSALSTTHAEDSPTGPRVVAEGVIENRLTGLGIHLLIGASIFFVPLLAMVPMACLYGIFLYMGIASLAGNQLAQRVTLWARDPSLYPPMHFLRRICSNLLSDSSQAVENPRD
ncbi:MAG: PTS sugar transporter subunit IIA [Planctomycetes bacterium]|nr:PTS sugar transporter subunit IIA [Planctomycetota bacterium]